MIENDNILDLIQRSLHGKLNNAERNELDLWLAKPENKATYEQYLALHKDLNDISQVQKNYEPNLSKAWEVVGQHIAEKKKPHRFKIAYLAAASIALLAVIIGVNFINNSDKNISIVLKQGQKDTILFEDGSKAYAVGPAEISYPEDFNNSKRDISLNGYAFFDIARDETRPFTITTPKGTVEVLGTSFTVNTQEKNVFTVQCVTGKVRIKVGDGQKYETVLTRNEMASFKDLDTLLTKNNFEPINVSIIPKEDLIFEDQPLKEIIEAIERKYKVAIELENKSLFNVLYSTNLDKNSLTEVLSELELTFKMKVIKQNSTTFILKGGMNE